MQPNLNDKIAQAKAAGYSDTEIQGYLQGAGFQPPAPQGGGLRVSTPRMATAPTPTQTRGRGGTLTSLISEGGALGGAALGATLGSAVPVLGTAIGGIIGAGLGAFGGRLAENKVRDDRLGVTDALKEGAISAALAGPLRLGKYATVGAKGLIAGKGAQQALTSAAQEAAKFTIRGALGGKVTTASKDLIVKQFRLNPSQLTSFAKKHGEDVTELASRFKINNIDDIATKGINPLQSTFDEIIDQVPSIPKSNLRKIIDKEINTLLKSPVLENKKLGMRLAEQADALLKSQPAKIPGVVASSLKQEFDDAVKYTLNGTPERTVVKRTADALRKTLQEAADKAGLTGPNGMSMKDLGRNISKLIDFQTIAEKQANLGRGSLPLGIITSLDGVSGGAALGGPVGAGAGMLATEFVNSPAGRRLLSQAGTSAGQRLTTGGARAAEQGIRQAVLGATRGTAARGLTSAAMGQPTLEDSLTQLQPTFTEAGQFTPEGALVGAQPTGAGATTTTPTAAENPFTTELLITAIAADPKNAALYERLYKLYEDKYKAAVPKKLTEAQQAREDIISLANQAKSQLASGRIKTGLLAGNFEQLKAIVGKADQSTLDFNTTVSALLATIAKARGGTSFTPNEEKMLERYAPKVGDSRQQLETKIDALVKQFGQPTNATTLEELLLSQAGGAQ